MTDDQDVGADELQLPAIEENEDKSIRVHVRITGLLWSDERERDKGVAASHEWVEYQKFLVLSTAPAAGLWLRFDANGRPFDLQVYRVIVDVASEECICELHDLFLKQLEIPASMEEAAQWFIDQGFLVDRRMYDQQPQRRSVTQARRRQSGQCPSCGFAYRWNDESCGHCGYPKSTDA